MFRFLIRITIQSAGIVREQTPRYSVKGGFRINHNRLSLAYLCAALNAAIIGFSFLFVKIALEYASPIDTLTYRFAVSFAAMTFPVIFRRIRLNYRGKPLLTALLLAMMYPLAFFAFQTYGLRFATSSEGGILFAFAPVLTMLLAAIFLKETTTLLQRLSIGLSVIGVIFIFLMKGSGFELSSMTGIFLLFLSCLSIAGYNVLARSILRTYRPMEISYLMLGIGFIAFLAVSLSGHAAAGTFDRLLAPLAEVRFMMSILYLGVMSSLVTSLAANYALSKMEASRMSVFSNLSTVVSIVAGAVVMGEPIEAYHIVGSALIIAGVLGTNYFAARNTKPRPLQSESADA
ncbi:DMT family transporter [Paenibacillus thailandensis]|uniref:DMT family transporter n=1 Tax=Paenibacillus thailandensis TaxID=393250 RepID=A0ABW5R1Z0_9BACL